MRIAEACEVASLTDDCSNFTSSALTITELETALVEGRDYVLVIDALNEDQPVEGQDFRLVMTML
jgi:hypothetical protein